jgi:hypothetical protein
MHTVWAHSERRKGKLERLDSLFPIRRSLYQRYQASAFMRVFPSLAIYTRHSNLRCALDVCNLMRSPSRLHWMRSTLLKRGRGELSTFLLRRERLTKVGESRNPKSVYPPGKASKRKANGEKERRALTFPVPSSPCSEALRFMAAALASGKCLDVHAHLSKHNPHTKSTSP